MVLQSIMRSTPVRSPRKSVRFASPIILHAHSLSSYLRSPYPSAPVSSIGQTDGDNQWPKYRDADDVIFCARPAYLSPVTLASPRPSPSVGCSTFSPAVASINRAKKPAPLNLESCFNEDFQQALVSEETADSADEPMVTALESAVRHEENRALLSAGILTTHNKIRDSLMSPGKKSSFGRIVRKDFTAPSPNDPFAAFPSFTAALSMGS